VILQRDRYSVRGGDADALEYSDRLCVVEDMSQGRGIDGTAHHLRVSSNLPMVVKGMPEIVFPVEKVCGQGNWISRRSRPALIRIDSHKSGHMYSKNELKGVSGQ
jgi:hypothetical protein